jgi:hypothetical protein
VHATSIRSADGAQLRASRTSSSTLPAVQAWAVAIVVKCLAHGAASISPTWVRPRHRAARRAGERGGLFASRASAFPVLTAAAVRALPGITRVDGIVGIAPSPMRASGAT